ncbi:hypothetical protein BJX64DRAFT_292539 [Aspergillus heterothallicus]
MAEALGVAASAISVLTLTAQIIDSIDKLRGLHTFVKTASVEFEDLLAEIEIIQAVLQTLTPEMLALLKLPAAERRLQLFHQDLEILITKVSKYKSMADRRLGAVKLVLRRETFRIQRQNLDNLKSTLSLLQLACYHASLSYSAQKLTPAESRISSPGDDSSTKRQIARKAENRRQYNKLYKAEYRIRTALFFWDTLWTFNTTNVHGWKFTIQVNNVVPFGSPVVQHCRAGDVEGVQKLFSAGVASPFDCLPNGRGLLHLAVEGGPAMCRFLLKTGVNLEHGDNRALYPVCYFKGLIQTCNVSSPDENSLYDLYNVFLSNAEEALFENDSPNYEYHTGYSGPAAVLDQIQNHSFDRYSELPLDFRFKRAMKLNAWANPFFDMTLLKTAMGNKVIDPAAYVMQDERGQTILHKVAEAMGRDLALSGDVSQWRELLSDAILGHSDLHKPWRKYDCWMTPLVVYIASFALAKTALGGRITSIDFPLQVWLSELNRLGIDLKEYGEKEVGSQFGLTPHFGLPMLGVWESSPTEFVSVCVEIFVSRILAVTHSAEPEGWHAWLTNPFDELVGEFWEMVDRTMQVMPGTWID